MKKILIIVVAGLMLTACADTQNKLQQRAFELCRYIPDHRLLEQSKEYLTDDFYALLDTMFNRLPSHEAMDHEWLYYFVTGNGGTIADYEVVKVSKTDPTHATAFISVRQMWEDGSFDADTDVEEHQLYMEKVNGRWLMSDFDLHKADCIRHIAISRDEQARRQAISDYLVREVGPLYLKGELCHPTLMIVNEENDQVWGDFWVYWYNASADTLKCISGGNYAGLMTLDKTGPETYYVTSFVQVSDGAGYTPSARRIFRDHYEIFENIHSNSDVREAVRCKQLSEYIQAHNLPYRYYQDYGWPAVKLEL